MSGSLQKLIEISSKVRMTEQEIERQRRSFAYGSSRIENALITKEMVDQAAEKIRSDQKKKNG